MTYSSSPFRIIVYTASGTMQGELASVVSVNNFNGLDKMGGCDFEVVATDESALLIQPGVYFDIYDEIDGFIGRFYYLNASISYGRIAVSCEDEITALRRQFVGYRRDYTFDPVENVVNDLLSVIGWSSVVDSGIGNTSVTFEGETVLTAIDVLRDRWGSHFRLGTSASQLEFGAFGVNNGILLTRLEGQVQSLFAENENVVHIDDDGLVQSIDVSQLYNRIIATGSGQGSEAELTMENCVVGSYPVQSGLNADGTSYFYIEDAASIAAYGLRVRVAKFTGIRALSMNDTDIQRAKDAVKYAAEAYLVRHKAPRIECTVNVVGLRSNVRVGDKVDVVYKAVGDGTSSPYLDIDDEFYVMDIDRRRDVNGDRGAQLSLCSTDARRTQDTDIIVDVIRDVEVLKLHVQPHQFWSENTYTDTIQGWPVTTDKTYKAATFKIEIDNSVLKLTKVRIRFKTIPLWTTTNHETVVAGESPEISNIWQVLRGYNYPYRVRMFINGIDVSADFVSGGVWATTNVALDVICDITDYIRDAVGGMYQDHVIMFTAEARSGDASVTYTPPRTQTNSNGFVEFNVRVHGVTTGILPT